MSHTPHELAEEFPADVERISAMRQTNAHFARLCDEYHRINRAIHRAETRVEPLDDPGETALRRARMVLKDQISGFLRTA